MLAASVSFDLDTSIFGRFKFPSLLTCSPFFSALCSVASNFDDDDDDDDDIPTVSSCRLSFLSITNHLYSHDVAIFHRSVFATFPSLLPSSPSSMTLCLVVHSNDEDDADGDANDDADSKFSSSSGIFCDRQPVF